MSIDVAAPLRSESLRKGENGMLFNLTAGEIKINDKEQHKSEGLLFSAVQPIITVTREVFRNMGGK